MTDWLRPMFRGRIPVPSSSTTSTERQSSLNTEDNNDFDESMSRLRPTSRVSSHIGLASSTTLIPQAPDLLTNMRAPLDVYYKPSPDQMAESLKVVMMNQSSTESVPISMNSCILHVLEAYQDLRQQLNQKEETVEELKEELKQSHTRDIKEFENLTTQWEEKEKDYKSEIKRLEVLLSKTKDGMEKVSLARSKSRVHGSRGSVESITRGIDTIKARHAARSSIYGDQSERDSSLYSMQPSTQDSIDRRICSRPSNKDLHVASPNMMNSIFELTKSHLEALEREQFEEQHEASFDWPASVTTTNQSFYGKASILGVGVGLEINIHNKPLPGIPQSPLLNMEAKISSRSVSESNEEYQTELEEERRPGDLMSFSFNPGDDTSILTQDAKYEVKKKKAAGNYTCPDRSPIVSRIPEQPSESPSTLDTSLRRRSETPVQKQLQKSITIANPAISRETQDSDSLRRDDSISSVVTAVRDSSGRSSAAGSIQISQNSRQRLNRRTGSSSEAVTAAVRALAAVNVKGRMTGSGSYGEGSGGSKGSCERRPGSASCEEQRGESSKLIGEAVRDAGQNEKTSSGASSTVGASIGRSETSPKKQEKRNDD